MITLKESSKNIRKRPKNTMYKTKFKKKNKPSLIKSKTTKNNQMKRTTKSKNIQDHKRKK